MSNQHPTDKSGLPHRDISGDGAPANARNLLYGDFWDYAPAPETPDHVRYQSSYGHFIDGRFVEGQNHFQSINPATEEPLLEVAEADAETVDKAVQAARTAYEKYWKPLKGSERAKHI
jgi:aldehyde dehydrogenase (NAD+)